MYEHWRPDTNRPFYVGKGRGYRASALRGRNKKHKSIVARAGGRIVKFVARGLSESEAFNLECERISLWRSMGLPLANFTDGGEGASGAVQSTEAIERRSAALRGRKRSVAERQSISEGLKGRKFTPEWRAKMSAAAKSRKRGPPSADTRAKIGAANKLRAAERRVHTGEVSCQT